MEERTGLPTEVGEIQVRVLHRVRLLRQELHLLIDDIQDWGKSPCLAHHIPTTIRGMEAACQNGALSSRGTSSVE